MILLALSMSVDAFAAALVKGAAAPHQLSRVKIIWIALIFGITETITPLVGWLLGRAAQHLIEDLDHWVAFGLLTVLGIRMIYSGCRQDAAVSVEQMDKKHSWFNIMLTAFATSIDALIIGVSLAFLNVNIISAALVIGVASTGMAVLGLSLGKILGNVVGKRVEIIGGLVLIGIGTTILAEHLHWFGSN